jgi:hypothetical protein
VLVGGLAGGLSHPLLDGIMHGRRPPLHALVRFQSVPQARRARAAPPRLCCRGALRRRLPDGLEAPRFPSRGSSGTTRRGPS